MKEKFVARAARVEIGVLAEADVGLGRVGVNPSEQLLHLAQCIEKLPHLSLEGITFYPGQIKDVKESGLRALAQVADLLRAVLDEFRAAGMELKIVSGGSTPTLGSAGPVRPTRLSITGVTQWGKARSF